MKKLSLKAKLYLSLAAIAIVLLGSFSLFAIYSSDEQRLKFTYNEVNDSYVVSDIKNAYRSGWFAHKEITIPSTHKGKRVSSVHLIYSPFIEKVNISEGITTLEYSAFNGDSKLKEVVLPSSLTFIDGCCFQNCVLLDSINLKDSSVTSLPLKCFQNCKNLILDNDDLSKINSFGEYCLSNTGISSFTFKDDVTKIPNYMFDGCLKLTTVNMPNGVTEIGEGSFNNTPLFNIGALPTSLTKIGANAFSGSGITSVVIPSGVSEINKNTFSECKKLEVVTLNEGLTIINDKAFYNCSKIENISIPSTVTKIGNNAFRSTSISSVTIPDCTYNATNSFNNDCVIAIR